MEHLLPPKTEFLVRVDLSNLQKEYYKALLTKVRICLLFFLWFLSIIFFFRTMRHYIDWKEDKFRFSVCNFFSSLSPSSLPNIFFFTNLVLIFLTFYFIDIVMELKKCSNHPYLFDNAEPPTTTPEEALRYCTVEYKYFYLFDFD